MKNYNSKHESTTAKMPSPTNGSAVFPSKKAAPSMKQQSNANSNVNPTKGR